MSRFLLGAISLVALVALPAQAGSLYINGVLANGAHDQELKGVNVRFDSDGNVYVDAPGYKVEVEGAQQAPPQISGAPAQASAAQPAVPPQPAMQPGMQQVPQPGMGQPVVVQSGVAQPTAPPGYAQPGAQPAMPQQQAPQYAAQPQYAGQPQYGSAPGYPPPAPQYAVPPRPAVPAYPQSPAQGYPVVPVAAPPGTPTATVPAVATAPAPAGPAQITKHYWLVTQQTDLGSTQYTYDLFINAKWILRLANDEDPHQPHEITSYLHPGANAIVLSARKDLSGDRRSFSPDNVYRVIIGTGNVGGNRVLIDSPLIVFERNAAQVDNASQSYTLVAE